MISSLACPPARTTALTVSVNTCTTSWDRARLPDLADIGAREIIRDKFRLLGRFAKRVDACTAAAKAGLVRAVQRCRFACYGVCPADFRPVPENHIFKIVAQRHTFLRLHCSPSLRCLAWCPVRNGIQQPV